MSGDRRDEQQQEIDCLLSMFPEELNVVEKRPSFIFEITLRNIAEEEADCEVDIILRFKLGDKYPDEAPDVEIAESSSLSDEELAKMIEGANKVCQDSLGMPMIFSVIMFIQDELAVAVQRVVRDARDATERAKLERELAEKRRFHGTAVTVESFLGWKRRYDAEILAMRQAKLKSGEIIASKKPTGKELFQRDESLIDATGIADDDEIEDSEEDEEELEDESSQLNPDLGVDE